MFTGEVQDGNQNIILNEHYNRWFEKLRGDYHQFSLMLHIIMFIYCIKFKLKFQDVSQLIQLQ